MNTSPDHPDFTALALGEHIHGTPAQAVLEALRTSVAARVEAEQIQNMARQLAFVLKGQPPLRLDDDHRSAILNADPAEVFARFAAEEEAVFEPVAAPVKAGPKHTWIFPTLAAAAVAAVVVIALRMLPGYTPPSQRPGPIVETPSNEGRIMVQPRSPATSHLPGPEQKASSVDVAQDAVPPPPAKGSDLPPKGEFLPPGFMKEAPLPSQEFPGIAPDPYAQPILPGKSNANPAASGSSKHEPARGRKTRILPQNRTED